MKINPEHPAWEKAMDAAKKDDEGTRNHLYKETTDAIRRDFERWEDENQQLLPTPVNTKFVREMAAKAAVDFMWDYIQGEEDGEDAEDRFYPHFVPKYYVMDPETDHLLFDGNCLENGMVVLMESTHQRVEISEITTDEDMDKARKWNRWITVSNLVKDDLIRSGHDRKYVRFLGMCEDGTLRKYMVSSDYAWYVKKDSLPAKDGKLDEKDLGGGTVTFKDRYGRVESMSYADFLKDFSATLDEAAEEVKKEYETRGGIETEHPIDDGTIPVPGIEEIYTHNDSSDGSEPAWVAEKRKRVEDATPNLYPTLGNSSPGGTSPVT